MKRYLTHQEQTFATAALEFYQKFGPTQTLVADHSGSYPDDPEQSIVFADRSLSAVIIEVINNYPGYDEEENGPLLYPRFKPAADYYAMLKAYFDDQYDDVFDMLALIQALNRFTFELAFQTRERV